MFLLAYNTQLQSERFLEEIPKLLNCSLNECYDGNGEVERIKKNVKSGDCIFAKSDFVVEHEICDSTFTNTCEKCIELNRYGNGDKNNIFLPQNPFLKIFTDFYVEQQQYVRRYASQNEYSSHYHYDQGQYHHNYVLTWTEQKV